MQTKDIFICNFVCQTTRMTFDGIVSSVALCRYMLAFDIDFKDRLNKAMIKSQPHDDHFNREQKKMLCIDKNFESVFNLLHLGRLSREKSEKLINRLMSCAFNDSDIGQIRKVPLICQMRVKTWSRFI